MITIKSCFYCAFTSGFKNYTMKREKMLGARKVKGEESGCGGFELRSKMVFSMDFNSNSQRKNIRHRRKWVDKVKSSLFE